MKRFLVVAAVTVIGSTVAFAKAKPAAKPASTMKDENCGAMMKQMSALPAKFNELMVAVTDGMNAHASWIAMNKDPKAQAEATAMKKIAQDHADLATAAKKAQTDMEAAASLAPAAHDMSKMDPKVMAAAMMKQATLEKEMANMMLKDAEETEKQAKAMTAGGQAGQP